MSDIFSRQVIVCATLLVLFFVPVLHSGLYSDDLPNFQTKTIAPGKESKSVIELASPGIAFWLSVGRINPLPVLWQEFVFKHFTSIFMYKCLMVLLNIAAVFAFLLLLTELYPSTSKVVWMLCLGAVVQFRIPYHDAYTSFNGMYQLMAIGLFAGLYFYARHLKLPGTLYNFIYLCFFIVGLLLSEIGLVFIPIAFCIALARLPQFTAALKSIVPSALTGIVYLTAIVWLRANAPVVDGYVGLTSNYNPAAMVSLLVKQVFAAVPLSGLYGIKGVAGIIQHQLSFTMNWIGVIAVIGAALYIWVMRKDHITHTNLKPVELLPMLALMVLPAVFILPSLKYQVEVITGQGYLPVYLQNFGTATLLATVIQYGLTRGSQALRNSGGILMGLVTMATIITMMVNTARVHSMNYHFAFPAQVLFNGINQGLLDSCAAGSTLVLSTNYFWQSPATYEEIIFYATGKKMNVCETDTCTALKTSQACYYVQCDPGEVVNLSLSRINCDQPSTRILISRKQYPFPVILNDEELKIR